MQAINRSSWLVSLKRHSVELLSILLLVSWASLLTVHTVQLQNSCVPLLEWTDISARQCLTEILPPPRKTPETHRPEPVKPPNFPPQEPPGEVYKSSSGSGISKDFIGIAVGSTAIVGLAVIEAPFVIAAGAGVAVWFVARTLISLSN